MKKCLSLILCLLLVFVFAACGDAPEGDAPVGGDATEQRQDAQENDGDKDDKKDTQKEDKKDEQNQDGAGAEVSDPSAADLEEFDSLEKASNWAGFSLNIPDGLLNMGGEFQAAEGYMIQVVFLNEEADDSLSFRKAKVKGDISADKTAYSNNSQTTVEGVTVNLRGESGVYHVITWSVGDYSYAVESKVGVDDAAVNEMVKVVK